MANIGYARVSTNGQDLALQQEALKAAGCEKVYAEKISGARSDRPQLARMLKAIGAGDTVVVTRLDRLARSTLDLLHTVDLITKAGAGFRSLADTWADTATPHGKLMLTVLGGLCERLERQTRCRKLCKPAAHHPRKAAGPPRASLDGPVGPGVAPGVPSGLQSCCTAFPGRPGGLPLKGKGRPVRSDPRRECEIIKWLAGNPIHRWQRVANDQRRLASG